MLDFPEKFVVLIHESYLFFDVMVDFSSVEEVIGRVGICLFTGHAGAFAVPVQGTEKEDEVDDEKDGGQCDFGIEDSGKVVSFHEGDFLIVQEGVVIGDKRNQTGQIIEPAGTDGLIEGEHSDAQIHSEDGETGYDGRKGVGGGVDVEQDDGWNHQKDDHRDEDCDSVEVIHSQQEPENPVFFLSHRVIILSFRQEK